MKDGGKIELEISNSLTNEFFDFDVTLVGDTITATITPTPIKTALGDTWEFEGHISLNIIDIIDSCENIDEWVIDNEYNEVDEARKTNSRYKTIQKKLLALLQTQGVSKIEFPDNRLIVGLCEVVETEADKNRKNDDIISK